MTTSTDPKVLEVYERLNTVIDPELGISIVKLGLIYEVHVDPKSDDAAHNVIRIVMTLTTPGCPLAAVFDQMLKDSLYGLTWLASDQDVQITLTFDPPWVPEMMDEEAKAELGF
jgi:metal-sulfur cluster biosynthetic enzyme